MSARKDKQNCIKLSRHIRHEIYLKIKDVGLKYLASAHVIEIWEALGVDQKFKAAAKLAIVKMNKCIIQQEFRKAKILFFNFNVRDISFRYKILRLYYFFDAVVSYQTLIRRIRWTQMVF